MASCYLPQTLTYPPEILESIARQCEELKVWLNEKKQRDLATDVILMNMQAALANIKLNISKQSEEELMATDEVESKVIEADQLVVVESVVVGVDPSPPDEVESEVLEIEPSPPSALVNVPELQSEVDEASLKVQVAELGLRGNEFLITKFLNVCAVVGEVRYERQVFDEFLILTAVSVVENILVKPPAKPPDSLNDVTLCIKERLLVVRQIRKKAEYCEILGVERSYNVQNVEGFYSLRGSLGQQISLIESRPGTQRKLFSTVEMSKIQDKIDKLRSSSSSSSSASSDSPARSVSISTFALAQPQNLWSIITARFDFESNSSMSSWPALKSNPVGSPCLSNDSDERLKSLPEVSIPVRALRKAREALPMELASAKSDASRNKGDAPKPKLNPLHWDKVRANSEREMVGVQLKFSSVRLNEEMIESLNVVNSSRRDPDEEMIDIEKTEIVLVPVKLDEVNEGVDSVVGSQMPDLVTEEMAENVAGLSLPDFIVEVVVNDGDSSVHEIVVEYVVFVFEASLIEGTYPILGTNGCKRDAVLSLSIQYTPVEQPNAYQEGVGAGPEYLGVHGMYFSLRKDGKVTFYQDAHVPKGSTFYIMHEDGLMIWTVKKSEVKVLSGTLSSYYHVSKHENTLVTKSYCVRCVNSLSSRFKDMDNEHARVTAKRKEEGSGLIGLQNLGNTCFMNNVPQFSGYNQHDSQVLLAFLLDGLHENLMEGYKAAELSSEENSKSERSLVSQCQSVAVMKLTYRVSCQQPGVHKGSGDAWAMDILGLMLTNQSSIPVFGFPQADPSQVDEISSDTSLAEAVQKLAKHKILSAPVLNVDAPGDATWLDRYIGVAEFARIVVWTLHQWESGSTSETRRSSAMDLTREGPSVSFRTALAAASSKIPEDVGTEPTSPTVGYIFEALTGSHFYSNSTVTDISGSFCWVPFLALETSNSLIILLLVSNYIMRRIPGKIDLPLMSVSHLIVVSEDDQAIQAIKLMKKGEIGEVLWLIEKMLVDNMGDGYMVYQYETVFLILGFALVELVFQVYCCLIEFHIFASPRPPEVTDLEDKVKFKGGRMLWKGLRGAISN